MLYARACLAWIVTVAAMPAAMLCEGCAFGHRVVALNYTPVTNSSDDGHGKAVYVATINDVSPTNEVSILARDASGQLAPAKGKEIGDIRNEFYMKTACVVSKSMDLGPWVTDALTKELKQHGYQVIQVTSLPPQCPLGLSGALSECYSKMKFFGGQVCTLKVTISIHKNGAVVSSKQYVGHCRGGLTWGTAREYEKIFQSAMTDLVTKIVADVTENSQ